MPILSNNNTFITIWASQPNLHAAAPMEIFIRRPTWPISCRWIYIYCHWCLFQVPRDWTPKGHFLKKFDQGIRVGIFQTWLPMTLKTDNGVNLVSVKPENYLRSKGIHRAKSATFWPRSNGEVERYNRTSLKSILAIHAKRKDWRSYFNSMLLDYHSTKHVTTQIAQSMLLFRLQTYHVKIKQKNPKKRHNSSRSHNEVRKDFIDEASFSQMKESRQVQDKEIRR